MSRPLSALLYSSLYLPAAPAIAAYLLWRRDSRHRWRDYLGNNRFEGGPPEKGGLWVHAVSAGEVLSVAPLVQSLCRQVDFLKSTVLTTTIDDALNVAGRRAADTYGSRTFLPLDLTRFMRRLLDRMEPSALLLSETDLWPNLLLELRRRRIPAYLANGRISPGAGKGYRAVRFLMGPALEAIRLFFVQTEEDRTRLLDLGVDPVRVRIRANTKYDRPGGPPAPDHPSSRWLKASGRPVLVAGSTHGPEEERLLQATASLSSLVRVLVPRNPERARAVAALEPGALLWSRRSGEGLDPTTRTVVVDTMGELDDLYGAADVVVVGGSFGGHQGHNFLEPAWHGKPIICGPDMSNFRLDVERFLQGDALLQLGGFDELEQAITSILEQPERASQLGSRARSLVEEARGGGEQIAREIAADLIQARQQGEVPRVLFCLSSSGIGGGERHVIDLMAGLKTSGQAAPSLACPAGSWAGRQARERGIPVEPLPFAAYLDLFTAVRLSLLARSGRFDMLHSHLNVATFLAGLATRLPGSVPAVATAHGLSTPVPYGLADHIIAVSDAVAQHLAEGRPDLMDRTTRIYSGLAPWPASSLEEVARFREGLRIGASEPVLAVIGKFHRNKNHRLLLEAASFLPGQLPWKLMLVGAGPEEADLRRRARELDGRVVFPGALDDRGLLLGSIQLLVVPSWKEAFGLAALEGQLAGVPILASDTGGLRELIENGATGHLFPPGDAEALGTLAAKFLNNPEPFQASASRALELSRVRFPLEETIQQTAEQSEELVGDRFR